MGVREQELLRTTIEQERERERLENLERYMAVGEASYQERLAKANAMLDEKAVKCKRRPSSRPRARSRKEPRSLPATTSRSCRSRRNAS